MKRQRVRGLLGVAIALGIVGVGSAVAVIGCNTGGKDDTANSPALKEMMLTQDKHAARLAELEAKEQKAEQQATQLAEQSRAIADLEKQVKELKKREPTTAVASGSPELEAILKEIAAELRNRPAAPRTDPDAALKYMHGIAEALLTATLERSDQSMSASLTRSYKANIAGDAKEGTPEYTKAIAAWCFGRSGGPKEEDRAVYKEWKITSELVAPTADEASFEGTLSKPNKGQFTLRIVKDKESGKFLVDFFGVKHGE